MKGWIMFNKIKALKEQNLKITQIARILNSDVRTIKNIGICHLKNLNFLEHNTNKELLEEKWIYILGLKKESKRKYIWDRLIFLLKTKN